MVLSIVASASSAAAAGTDLFVCSVDTHEVLRYDGTTGAFIGVFVPAGSGGLSFPGSVIFGPDGNMYVSSQAGGILRYSGATGAFIDVFVPTGSGGYIPGSYVIFGPDGNLYASDFLAGDVKKYNGTTGEFMGVFTSGAPLIYNPVGLRFGPDGNLYVADEVNVLRFSGSTGTFIDVFVENPSSPPNSSPSPSGLWEPVGLTFGPDGNLYVGSSLTHSVLRYDGTTGAFIDAFVPPGTAGLDRPHGVVFGADGNLYVADESSQILRFSGSSGEFIDAFVSHGSGGLNKAAGITFGTPPATNQSPTALAGANQTARPGIAVHLDGSGSYDDNTPTNLLVYSWSITARPEGSTADFSGANTATPTFTPDVAGNYAVQLIVTDQAGLTSAASQLLIGENLPPIASAGLDQVVIVNHVATLFGSLTDADGDSITSEWSFVTKPSGSTPQFYSPTQSTTTFVPDLPGTYVVRLTPSDLLGVGVADDAQITVTTATTYAESQAQIAATLIGALPSTAVTTGGNQNALVQFLSNATTALRTDKVTMARQQLQQAISRTDGCAFHGAPDGIGQGRDWVTTCATQNQIYPLLTAALAAIAP